MDKALIDQLASLKNQNQQQTQEIEELKKQLEKSTTELKIFRLTNDKRFDKLERLVKEIGNSQIEGISSPAPSFGVRPASHHRGLDILNNAHSTRTNILVPNESNRVFKSPDLSTFDSQKMMAIGIEGPVTPINVDQNFLLQQYNLQIADKANNAMFRSPSNETLNIYPNNSMSMLTNVVSVVEAAPQQDSPSLTPAQLSAKQLNATFLPLQVKYKDMKDFEKSAKKTKNNSKYPTIPSERFQEKQ